MGGLLWEVEAPGYLGAMLGTTMTLAVGRVVLYRVTWGRYPFGCLLESGLANLFVHYFISS